MWGTTNLNDGGIMRFRLSVLALVLELLACTTAKAQNFRQVFSSSMGSSRWLIDTEIGSATGLGFKFPHMALGFTMERPIKRAELQTHFLVSPDVKSFARSGHDYQTGVTGLVWLTHRIAAQGGVSYSIYWSAIPNQSACIPDDLYPGGCRYEYTYSPYHKGGTTLFVGAVMRDSWFGSPGRFYIQYYVPTGCQWATPSNPCQIQSSRTQGIGFQQEFRLWEHWRVGLKGAWLRYADQSNPYAPELGRTWHNTGTMTAIIRFEMGSFRLRSEY